MEVNSGALETSEPSNSHPSTPWGD